MAGAAIGGWIIARYSLRKTLVPMTLFVVIVNSGYLLVSLYQVNQFLSVALLMVIVQFAFGLSNSAYMSYLLFVVAKGQYKMSSYAIGTAIMALGMVMAGAVSGYIQQELGYAGFFGWIIIVGIVICLITLFITKYGSYILNANEI